ncbi:hypothetical protein [Methanoregula sp.]|uniref:hypothetical protein n=1 Tax=Methanoregula sp. TaxID=2052170 RepID=UPI000CA9F5D8|nr:hypothetical protein [Methanoregula sp.]PKG32153.1 MAG: hypothetical protein CW742_09640 [Methanoregula sp.]
MDILTILVQILKFFWQVLPYIFIGFVIANLIKASRYFDLIGLPMSVFSRLAHLPNRCSSALTLYLLNSYSALGLLSENFRENNLDEKHVLITVLVAYFPKGINTIVFFLAPVALSVFGLFYGMAILGVEFTICMGITLAGIIGGRILFAPPHLLVHGTTGSAAKDPVQIEAFTKTTLVKCLKDSIRDFYEICLVLVPTGALIIFLFNIGVQDTLQALLQPLFSLFHLPASSVIVFAAAFVSQVAAISATGTVAAGENLTLIQCLIIYALSRSLHLGIGQIKTGLPTNIALFGKSLGVKVTALDFTMTQLTTVIVVIILLIISG